MVNQTLPPYSVLTATLAAAESQKVSNIKISWQVGFRQAWSVFGAAVFLVTVPVFVEAPLVRSLPWLSLVLTAVWVWLSYQLMSKPKT